MLTDSIQNLLKPHPSAKTLIVTIGNDIRHDDGAGPYIAGKITPDIKNYIILNAGDKPENIPDKLTGIRPLKTILIDTANFGGDPGETRILDGENIMSHSLSTHTFPIKIIARLIEEDTGGKVFFLGIQPENAGMGRGLSPAVKKTADEIVEILNSGGEYA